MLPWIILLGLLATLGCGTDYGRVPGSNIIMVNTEGNPVDPTGNVGCETNNGTPCNGRHSSLFEYPQVTSDEYKEQLNRITSGLQQYLDASAKNGAAPKIIIFIHGGLNLQTDTVERAKDLHETILQESKAYPIFINWQSSLPPSYNNHLFHIRQGEDWRDGTWSSLGGYATSPFYLAADLMRAVARAPVVTFFQIRNDIETVPAFRPALSLWSSDLTHAQEAAFEAICRHASSGPNEYSHSPNEYKELLKKRNFDCKNDSQTPTHALANLNIWSGEDERTGWQKNTAFIKYFLTLPTKLVIAPLLDTLGTSSWDIMLRSVSQLFHYDGEQSIHTNLGSAPSDPNDYKQTGALSLFFMDLSNKICGPAKKADGTSAQEKRCANENNWEITLVGHSTGTIVIHHIIREFGHLPISNIVYMGAASTIKDYQNTIFPYLKTRNVQTTDSTQKEGATTGTSTGHDTNPPSTLAKCERPPSKNPVCVYHLMLHETAESGEWLNEYWDPTPRGSLLVWLDSFLSHPLSNEDRTIGRFTNFITAVHHTPQDLRPYIFATKFGVGEYLTSPQKHGHFSHLKFWRSECWKPTGIAQECFNH
jgi:hypothetical protein